MTYRSLSTQLLITLLSIYPVVSWDVQGPETATAGEIASAVYSRRPGDETSFAVLLLQTNPSQTFSVITRTTCTDEIPHTISFQVPAQAVKGVFEVMVAPPDTTPAANIPASFRQSGSFAVNALEVVPGQSVPGTSSASQPVPSSSVETTQNSPTQNSPTQSSLTQNSPTSNSPTQNSSTQNSPSLPSPTTGGSEPSKTSETVSSTASSFATVTITASADTSSKSTSSATAGAIAGGLTGSLAVIILIVFLIRRCHRRSGRTPFRSKPGPSAGIEPYMFASSTESSTGSIGTQSRSTTGLGIFSRISSRFSSLTEKGIFASSSADQDRRTGDIPQTRQQERSSIEKIAHDAMGLADVPALRDLNGSRRRGERDGDDESMNEAPPSYSSHYDSL